MDKKIELHNRRAREYYWANKEKALNKMAKYRQTKKGKMAKQRADRRYKTSNKYYTNAKIYKMGLKIIALQIYSNGQMRCKHCGYDENIDCLSLDHIDNTGNLFRKGEGYKRSIYQWVHSHGYPDNLQVLCRNCNWEKRMEQT